MFAWDTTVKPLAFFLQWHYQCVCPGHNREALSFFFTTALPTIVCPEQTLSNCPASKGQSEHGARTKDQSTTTTMRIEQ